MIARFLSEAMVQKSDHPLKLKAMIKKRYPEFEEGNVKDHLLDFFNFRGHSFFEADKKYRKVFFVFGDTWFALGRIAYFEKDWALDHGYHQMSMAFSYEDAQDPHDKIFHKGWNSISFGNMNGCDYEYLGKKEDIPFLFKNLDILFRRISGCNSAKEVLEILKRSSSGKTSWKPVK